MTDTWPRRLNSTIHSARWHITHHRMMTVCDGNFIGHFIPFTKYEVFSDTKSGEFKQAHCTSSPFDSLLSQLCLSQSGLKFISIVTSFHQQNTKSLSSQLQAIAVRHITHHFTLTVCDHSFFHTIPSNKYSLSRHTTRRTQGPCSRTFPSCSHFPSRQERFFNLSLSVDPPFPLVPSVRYQA